jgi:hypothetical protein
MVKLFCLPVILVLFVCDVCTINGLSSRMEQYCEIVVASTLPLKLQKVGYCHKNSPSNRYICACRILSLAPKYIYLELTINVDNNSLLGIELRIFSSTSLSSQLTASDLSHDTLGILKGLLTEYAPRRPPLKGPGVRPYEDPSGRKTADA